MKTFKGMFIFSFTAVLLILMTNILIAQERFSTLTGTVMGIRMKIWLDVQSEQDKAIVNFRIGRNTKYTPQRYPFVGEKVKVEYLIHRGSPVAYSVMILESQKEGPKDSAEEGTKESPK